MSESTALVPVKQTLPERSPGSQFAPQSFGELMVMADALAKSNLLPPALRGKPSDVLLTLMTGYELGLGPGQSMRGINIIEGKPTLLADLIIGLVMSQPTPCEYFRLVESSAKVATYETRRKGHPDPIRLSFTIEQAKAAGLVGKGNWTKYPDAMLRARAGSALARAVYPDKAFGIYDPDEIDTLPTATIQATPAATVTNGYTAPPMPAQDASFDPVVNEAETLRAAIAAVLPPSEGGQIGDLESWVPRLKAYDGPEKESLRSDYAAKRAEFP